jgi:hypothetical protein
MCRDRNGRGQVWCRFRRARPHTERQLPVQHGCEPPQRRAVIGHDLLGDGAHVAVHQFEADDTALAEPGVPITIVRRSSRARPRRSRWTVHAAGAASTSARAGEMIAAVVRSRLSSGWHGGILHATTMSAGSGHDAVPVQGLNQRARPLGRALRHRHHCRAEADDVLGHPSTMVQCHTSILSLPAAERQQEACAGLGHPHGGALTQYCWLIRRRQTGYRRLGEHVLHLRLGSTPSVWTGGCPRTTTTTGWP